MEMAGSSNAIDAIALALSALREELQYVQASTVNVSNFVSVKLSGCSNYDIWKAQMLCLIESQELLHIINSEHPFPVDKGVHMIQQYDKLVKGWIFGSMNGKVLKDFMRFESAQRVWVKLESLFIPAISYTLDYTLKFMDAFDNVEVSEFVTVKLSGSREYPIWKAEMSGLIENQELLHIIDAEHPFPEDKGVHMMNQYDKLVKSWIFCSVGEKVLEDLVSLESARDVWNVLESSFTPPISDTQENEKWNTSGQRSVDVSKFVTVELSGHKNYKIWKAQMLCLIESQALLHVIDAEYPHPEDATKHHHDNRVKTWMLKSMNHEVSKNFKFTVSAQYVWMKLKSLFDPRTSYTEGDARTDLKYMQASNVNVSNFISVKLSGSSNYTMWKAQMLSLIESQVLLHIIDDQYYFPCDKGFHMIPQYDELVKGWIFGSVNEKVLENLVQSAKAQEVWMRLKFSCSPRERVSDRVGFKFGTESVRDVPEIENTDRLKRLYGAAFEGCWWKAKSVLKIHENAATEPITPNGNTILHVAVEMGHNYFVKKMLEFLQDGKDIETKNDMGRTALHIAAMVGNEHAAQLLVQKRKELLEIRDRNEKSPLDITHEHMKLSMSACLLKLSPPSSLSHSPDSYEDVSAICAAISTKQYDLALTLLVKNPEAACNYESILMEMTLTFPTDLGVTESSIYPSFNNVLWKTVGRVSLLFHCNFLDKCVDDILRVVDICNNTYCGCLGNISMILVVPIATLYPLYQLICHIITVIHLIFSMLYFLVWKVLAVTVRPIKNIEKKKKEYQEAKKVLSLICNQMGTSNDGYNDSILSAVHHGTYEVVDEILFTSPVTINCKDEEGHNVIQLAIMYRSEKVYNLIHHIIECMKSYRLMKDSSRNNLVHLAGRLAPSSVLSRTTGAALQLQRELLWYKEVEKLLLPIQLVDENMYRETPAIVFTREHEDLMKQGEDWIKTTAESCSITAALIVTVVFAAAITVPGGSNQDSGIPVFKKETAFTVFAVFNAFSLFTAATSLLLFLSILTARFSEKDFLVSLPRRLILGLLTLFISTTAMIVAFGAILFLVFCDQRPWMLAPICGFALLPISVIVTVKVPLLVDLIRSTYFPIFGKQSYLESCKITRKNTIFTD